MRQTRAHAFGEQSSLARDTLVDSGRRIRRALGDAGWLVGFLSGLFAWQLAMSLMLLGGNLELGACVGLQLLGSVISASCLIWRMKTAIDDRCATALQMVAWVALLGPFGVIVSAAFLATPEPNNSAPAIVGDAVRSGKSAAAEPGEQIWIALLDRRLRVEGARRVRPLMDVISDGSQSEKLEALGVIYRRYDAGLSRVLKRALRDSDASIRVLAATVTAKLHGRFSHNLCDCQALVAEQSGVAQNWRRLAEARIAYAESGLLEAHQARIQIESAAGDLLRATLLEPGDSAYVTRSDAGVPENRDIA
jgi:hypothetical protein